MKTLNLVYSDKSDIPYKISKFPDGQRQVTIEPKSVLRVIEGQIIEGFYHPIKIQSRLNNFEDVELLICAVQSLKNLGVRHIELYCPFFLGSRSDRKFEEGSNNYLKQVICPIINSLNFKSVTVIDPHSDVLEACINNLIKIDNRRLVEDFIVDTNAKLSDFVLVSPDGGSLKKIYKIAEQINYNGDILVCSKSRDENGKLTKTHVPMTTDHNNKNLVIIDDICDGGATFINIAKEIKRGVFNGKIYLIVTHGIFSKGFGELEQYFECIYTSNSYKDFLPDTQEFIKQRNIFK